MHINTEFASTQGSYLFIKVMKNLQSWPHILRSRLSEAVFRAAVTLFSARKMAAVRVEVRSRPLPRYQAIAILVPHPDDEIIGCFHLIHSVGSWACIDLIYVTADRRQLVSEKRRREATLATHSMPIAQRYWWGFPDGDLLGHQPALEHELESLDAKYDVVLSPAPSDGTPDHAVLAKSALRRIPLEKLLWYRSTWLTFPLRDSDVVAAGDEREKCAALNAFGSQAGLALRNVVTISGYEARVCGMDARSVEAFRFARSGGADVQPINSLSIACLWRLRKWA